MAGGKRLRPLLTILVARAFGYERDDIYPLACSLEFLHSATLLHDDIVDGAPMATFVPEEGLLISSDAFGQNWATSERFADEVDRGLLRKQLDRYFANIVLPFSPIAQKTIATIESMLACACQQKAASLVGISVARMALLSFGISGLIGAVAGAILAPITMRRFAGQMPQLTLLVFDFDGTLLRRKDAEADGGGEGERGEAGASPLHPTGGIIPPDPCKQD